MATQPIDRQKAKAAIKQRTTRPMVQRNSKFVLPHVNVLLARLRPALDIYRESCQDKCRDTWFSW